MPGPICTDDHFIALCDLHRSAAGVAGELGINVRAVHNRRRRIEEKYAMTIDLNGSGVDRRPKFTRQRDNELSAEIQAIKPKRRVSGGQKKYKAPVNPDGIEFIPGDWRYIVNIRNGSVVVGSDAHYKPDYVPTAHRAMVHVVNAIKPAMVVLNGDLFDASSISRHFRIRWHRRYTVKEELGACQDRMGELEAVAGNAKLVRTWGNHDSNYETKLSGAVPEFEGVGGFTLWEHLPRWQPCMSVFVNDRPGGVVIKHRFKGGMHAPHNNALWSGRSMVTGHLHSAKVQPITDYNGTRYGVDSGCLASPEDGEAFHYAEDDPRNWRSGFVVLTFVNGELMPPELISILDSGKVWFRGGIVNV